MKPTLWIAAWCLCGAAWCEDAPVFRADFNGPQPLAQWTGQAGQVAQGYQGTPSLVVEQADAAGSANRRIVLPADRLAGRRITLSAVVKAENVSEPPKHWNGIKVMLIIETATGKDHPQLELGGGAFDWTEAARTLRVPKEATAVTLVLGLERVNGKAWFDDVQIRYGRLIPGGRRRAKMFKGHDLPRLRGVMHGPRFDEKNLRDLAAWGANQVRWQLNWVPMKEAEEWAQDMDRYDRWLDGVLADADKAIDACEKHGIMVLLDLHCPPGGRAKGGVCRMFSEEKFKAKFLQVWDCLARRYKGRDIIYAYDLINEPVEPTRGGRFKWRDLAGEAIRTIRAVDPGKPVVYEPGPWGGPGGFDQLVPLDADRVIYSFHMYLPHEFTHQFRHKTALSYPGKVRGVMWDKERLRAAMQPAIDFQQDFNVHMYVGEFSAIRWAPNDSAFRYLSDLTDLFEEYQWDWSYHAFREWAGWSVEHTTDPKDWKPSPTPTDREKLLRKWFALNQRPQAGTRP